jgi:nitrogen fixation protein NifQ
MTHKAMEEKLIGLLALHTTTLYASEEIAPLIAKKSLEMNHLYEAMTFQNRKKMNEFMQLHFPTLAQEKPEGVRWKKFLYDCIGAVAPACEGCPDEEDCFRGECSLEWHGK